MFYKSRIDALETEVKKMRETIDGIMRTGMVSYINRKDKPKRKRSRNKVTTSVAFGKRIREFMADAGMTRGDVAKGTGVAYNTLRKAIDEYQRKFVDELKRSYSRLSDRLATEVPTRELLANLEQFQGFWGALRTIIRTNFKRLCN